MVNYVGASSVWTKGLVYIGNDGVPVMQADSWTGLPTGQKRDRSVLSDRPLLRLLLS